MIILMLSVLSVYRLSYLIAMEEGPFSAAERLRSAVYTRWPDSWLDRGINCPLCVSFWLSWMVVLMPTILVFCLGIAGAVLVLHKLIERS